MMTNKEFIKLAERAIDKGWRKVFIKKINTALFRQEHTNSQKGKIKGKEIIKQGTIKEESNQTSKGTHK